MCPVQSWCTGAPGDNDGYHLLNAHAKLAPHGDRERGEAANTARPSLGSLTHLLSHLYLFPDSLACGHSNLISHSYQLALSTVLQSALTHCQAHIVPILQVRKSKLFSRGTLPNSLPMARLSLLVSATGSLACFLKWEGGRWQTCSSGQMALLDSVPYSQEHWAEERSPNLSIR